MRKIIIKRTGAPEVLEVVQAAAPSIAPDEVLVDVEAAGVNYVDVYQRNGAVDYLTPPFTPGFEGVGNVVALGENVLDLKVGDRVAWINALGSYAEQISLPVEQAIRVPQSFSTDQALLFQAVTAQYLVTEYADIREGSVVLVHAAAGGVGQFLVQWLKHLGAVVIGTASTAEKLNTIQSLGADHVVNYATHSFLEEVMRLTEGRGVDVVYDAVGKTTFSDSVKALAPRGIAVAYGQASGVAPDVQVYPLILKGARVAGGSIFTYILDADEMQARAAAAIGGITDGWLRPLPTTHFALKDAAAAHTAIESRGTQGKLAITMAIPT